MRGFRIEALAFEEAMSAVRSGEETFDTFVVVTKSMWTRYALYLQRRWRLPLAVSLEDLEQELLLAAWGALSTYEMGRGVTLQRYVVFVAVDKAKKWAHKQRDAYRRDDKSPSRFARTFTSLGCETDTDIEWYLPAEENTPDELLQLRQAWTSGRAQILAAAELLPASERTAALIIADCGGDLAAARERILEEPLTMLDMRLTDHMVAECVKRVAHQLVQRLGTTGGATT